MQKRLFLAELKWGGIFALMMFLWTCLEFTVGLHTSHKDLHPYLSMLVVFPSVALYVVALRDIRKQMGNLLPWLMAIRSGFVIGLVVAVLTPVYMYVFFTYINPHFFEDFAQFALEAGHYRTIEQARGYFNLSSYIWQGVTGAPSMGLVTGAVLGFFLKKDPPQSAE